MKFDDEKAVLREQAVKRRCSVTENENRAFACRIAEIGAAFAQGQAAKIISVYWAIGYEASTFRLIDMLATEGFATALPVIQRRGEPLAFRLWIQGDPTAEVRWGIREPTQGAEVFPDLLFVPLIAFDRAGNRLGYGGGFYDRTLARLRALQKIIAVGVAYAVQEMPEIPCECYDEKLDYVLTEREWIVCR